MIQNKKVIQKKRQNRVRRRLLDRSDLPRLTIKRSNKHLHAQVIDSAGKVLASASSLNLPSNSTNKSNKTNSSRQVGLKLAENLTKAKIKQAVLDRGHYRFHGRIKAFVEALRENKITI